MANLSLLITCLALFSLVSNFCFGLNPNDWGQGWRPGSGSPPSMGWGLGSPSGFGSGMPPSGSGSPPGYGSGSPPGYGSGSPPSGSGSPPGYGSGSPPSGSDSPPGYGSGSPPSGSDSPPSGSGSPPSYGSGSPPSGSYSPPGYGSGSPPSGSDSPPGYGSGSPPGYGSGLPPGGSDSPPGYGSGSPPGYGSGSPPSGSNSPPSGSGSPPGTGSEAGWSTDRATFYGPPTGDGNDVNACGKKDLSKPPYMSMVAAGNATLFQNGAGCGKCYQLKCTIENLCSTEPVTVTITDSSLDVHDHFFDLSGFAFGKMAIAGQEDQLRSKGIVDVQYKQVECNYNSGENVASGVDVSSNSN